MFSFLLRLTAGDRYAAEDFLQETFLRAWRQLDERKEVGLRPSWLFTVARRIVIDAVRARQVRPAETTLDNPADFASRRDDIDRFVERQTLREAVQGLRPLLRDALCELYYRERTIAEAARQLGVPEGTVKSRMHEGLEQLRKTLPQSQAA